MIGRRVAMLEEVTVAAPAYLDRHGVPEDLAALDGHRIVGFRSSASGTLMPLEFVVDGAIRNIALPATVAVNGAETLIAAARIGLGLIQAPLYHLEADIARGALVEVLTSWRPTPTPVSLLYPHSRRLSPRVRVFIDWVAGVFGR
jgi:DNA-binding transcriptional LysR family regulator